VRLFAAIRPPECVLESLEAELDRVRGPARFDRALRWTARELWHLTLAFYGDDDLESRSSWLRERVAGHGPLTLSLAGAGTFRGVLWVGVSEDVDELTALAEDVGGGGGRPYHPHVTLARWKAPRPPRSVRQVRRALVGYAGATWRATEVALMRSELSDRGPTYTVEGRFPLE
jgi:RNA 2',3'-cyclic 3'-phosphodiesterase